LGFENLRFGVYLAFGICDLFDFGFWNLEFIWILEFGFWDLFGFWILVFGIWNFSFSDSTALETHSS